MTDKPPFPNSEAQRATGDWNPMWDLMQEMDPEYLEAFLAFRAVPQRKGPWSRSTKR